MPFHSEVRVVPYSARQLFALVMDIEKYPEFLPWCLGARIRTRSDNYLEADVIIGYKIFRERFSSRVHFEHPHRIEVEYLKGPMRHLSNRWRFEDRTDGGCDVHFEVDFSLDSKMLETLVEQFFDAALKRMITAFEERAKDIL